MACQCDQHKLEETHEQFIQAVDEIIERVGTSRQVIIPLLQALQEKFNYLPAEAIERVYEKTEIDRAQLISVSTFYSRSSGCMRRRRLIGHS